MFTILWLLSGCLAAGIVITLIYRSSTEFTVMDMLKIIAIAAFFPFLGLISFGFVVFVGVFCLFIEYGGKVVYTKEKIKDKNFNKDLEGALSEVE